MEDENIFADFQREGESIDEVFAELEKQEVPAESQAEKTEEKSEVITEEPDLKKNETWKEMRVQLEAEREAREQLEARLAEIESYKYQQEVEQPEFLIDMIGENPEVAEKYMRHEEALKEKIKRELIEDQIKAQEKEKEQREYWNNWTNERLKEVETEFKVDFSKDESTKNELSKIMIDYSPTDEKGNLDYKKGMKILQALKGAEVEEEAQKTKAKKTIADATVSKETSTSGTKDYLTSNDFRGRSWRSIK